MNEQIYNRTALYREDAPAGASVRRTLADSLLKLNRIQWSAPWKQQEKRA